MGRTATSTVQGGVQGDHVFEDAVHVRSRGVADGNLL